MLITAKGNFNFRRTVSWVYFSQTVDLGKKGPIYDVKWSPAGDTFCAVYGFMPAKATLYNGRGDVLFDYGTGPRNCCFFNQHSSLLMLAGFGNLRGDVECWRVGGSNGAKHEKISEAQRGDTTYFEWAPGKNWSIEPRFDHFRSQAEELFKISVLPCRFIVLWGFSRRSKILKLIDYPYCLVRISW